MKIGSNHQPLRTPDKWQGQEKNFAQHADELFSILFSRLDILSRKFGAFVYTDIPAYSDLDDYIVPGFYGCATAQVAATISHCPRTDGNFTLIVSEKGPGAVFQQFNIGPYIYVRSRTAAGVWSSSWSQHGPLYDGLDSTNAGQALAATQGAVLKGMIDEKLGPGDTGAIAIASGSDLNSLLVPGDYYSPNSAITNSLSNCPFTGIGFRMLVISTATNYNQQLIFRGNSRRIYIRNVRKDGTDAGSWGQFISDFDVANNLTTTSEGSVLDARQGAVLNGLLGSKAGVTVVGEIAANSSATMTIPNNFRGMLVTAGAVASKGGIYIISANSSGTLRVVNAFPSSEITLTTATRSLTIANTAQYVAMAAMFNFVGEATV